MSGIMLTARRATDEELRSADGSIDAILRGIQRDASLQAIGSLFKGVEAIVEAPWIMYRNLVIGDVDSAETAWDPVGFHFAASAVYAGVAGVPPAGAERMAA